MFFTNDKIFFLEAQITIYASLIIWFTIPECFPLHVKGSVGTFEGPHLFGQFRLVSSVRAHSPGILRLAGSLLFSHSYTCSLRFSVAVLFLLSSGWLCCGHLLFA